MAAYDIQKHFKGLRADTGRRKGRDPFATGFEDDSDDDRRRNSRSKTTRAPPVSKPTVAAPAKTSVASPFAAIDQLRDSDEEFLDVPPKQRADRQPSPALATLAQARVTSGAGRRGSLDISSLAARAPRQAVALAAGPLAYLDDSEDEDFLPRQPRDRRPSPAPRKRSDSPTSQERSGTPRGDRRSPKEQPQLPRHTVASPFAGTKYLQDSDSEDDERERQSASRQGSTDSDVAVATPDELVGDGKKHLEVKPVHKQKQNGSGVSWRAFSAGRSEQRTAEIEALQASLQQRGRIISFCPHATTDDGNRVPLSPGLERPSFSTRGRSQNRTKSPPRRTEDTRPAEDELADGEPVRIYDPAQFKTNPFTDAATATEMMPTMAIRPPTAPHSDPEAPSAAFPTSASRTSPPRLDTRMTNIGSQVDVGAFDAIATKLALSSRIASDSSVVDHTASPVLLPSDEGPASPLSRNASARSLRRSVRIPFSSSRRSSRRSTSATNSISPAHAFLASLGSKPGISNDEEATECNPDEEGQAFGLKGEYIIGASINRGGFGVVKEAHGIGDRGEQVIRAVKIIRKEIPGIGEDENEKVQQGVEHEVSIWRHLDHPHILSLHAVYDTDFATFCVMDLNIGGTLFDVVRRCRRDAGENDGRKGLRSRLAKNYAYQLACALRYLHEDIRVCHRDVKLENCLIDMTGTDVEDSGGNLRLCDFGLADFLHNEQSIETSPEEQFSERLSLSTELPVLTASSVIGTLEYASPRGLSVNRKLFETAGDVWAFGVVVYTLCTGDLPFRHPMPSKTADLILRAEWDDTALRQAAAGGGEEVIDLVKGCLEKDIELRHTIGEALRSTWFAGCQEAERGLLERP